MITSPAFAGQRYAVLGLARSGQAAAASLLAGGARVTAWDAREEPRAAVLAEHPAAVLSGRLSAADPCAIDLTDYTAIVVSPGVPLNRHPIADCARAANVPLIGDIELFARARADLPPHRVVGITGTNGKSTTTALIHHLLITAGVPARMGGNIGLPILGEAPVEHLKANPHPPAHPELVEGLPCFVKPDPTAETQGRRFDKLRADGGTGGDPPSRSADPRLRVAGSAGFVVYVLELSSFQIDLTQRLDCDVAILLNLSPDHLDRHDGYAGYVDAKARLFGMQTGDHLAIVDAHARTHDDILRYAPAGQPVLLIDAIDLPGDQADWASLHGPHNRANAAAAVAAVRRLGLTDTVIEAGLKSFRGLPHRMERVGEAAGVRFINDSKATNPASTAPALAAFPPDARRPRIHWILGGLPKSDDLDECAPFFGHVAAAYTIGDAGPRFAEILEPHMPVERSEMLVEALRRAIAAAAPGDVVLLSPACASFDQFRDFEARGLAFRQIVAALTGSTAPGATTPARPAGEPY